MYRLSRVALAALIGATFVASGCGLVRLGKHNPPAGRKIVVDVQIEGNEAVPDSVLTKGLVNYADNFGSYDDKPLLTPIELEPDKRRIESAYAAVGFFEAKCTDHRVEPVDKVSVRVTFFCEDGPSVITRRIRYEGLDETPEVEVAQRRLQIVRDTLPTLVSLEEGEVWTYEAFERSRQKIMTTLRKLGFIYAEVVGDSAVDRDERWADVTFQIVPGPIPTISDVQVLGLKNCTRPSDDATTEQREEYSDCLEERKALEARIRRRIEFDVDQRVDPDLFRQTERQIVGLAFFYTVAVKPKRKPLDQALGDREMTYENLRAIRWPDEVKVTVTVQEKSVHEVQMGVGVAFDNTEQKARVSVGYSNRNFIGGLRRLDIKASPEYVVIPTVFSPERHGPGLESEIGFVQPSFFEEYLQLSLTAGYELEVEQFYNLHQVEGRLEFSRPFGQHLTVFLAYSAIFATAFDIADQSAVDALAFTVDVDSVLTFLEQGVTLDYRDDIRDARNGFYGRFVVKESLKGLGSNTDFLRFELDLRGYYEPWSFLGFAVRLAWKHHVLLGDDLPPFTQWFDGGGASDMRGYASQRMGPVVCYADTNGDGIADDSEYVLRNYAQCASGEDEQYFLGGNVSGLLSFEARLHLPFNFGLVAFVDVGQLWDSDESIDTSRFDVAVGPGLRYYTVIGPIRADLAYRATGKDTDRWVFHISIGQAF